MQFLGEQEALVYVLCRQARSFLLLFRFFFHGDFCHKAVWVYVTVPKCCVSPVIGWFVFLYAQSSSAGARAEAVGPAK